MNVKKLKGLLNKENLGCSQIILLKDYDTLLIRTGMENCRAAISLIKIIICGPTAGLWQRNYFKIGSWKRLFSH